MLPLLRTKTTIPQPRPKQIERARLLKRVEAGMLRALTLLVAPAGFGKTTLAAAWALRAGMPVAWVSLQPGERAPERFLLYMVQALQSISPQIGQTTLALLQGGAPEGAPVGGPEGALAGALYALINDLAGFPGELALVLDDYHAVDGPQVGPVIQFLLDNRPFNLHLLIASRGTPALSVTRLRALGQVSELTTEDVRFTRDEVRDFLERSMDLRLTAPDLARLNEWTEGWAVGLQLAGLALAHRPTDWALPNGQGSVTQGPAAQGPAVQAMIFDYLAEEVLRREPPEVQEFLQKTALFDRFCAPLCEAILGPGSGTPAKETLATIERANLFLVRLDATGDWFRYHALFGDFLRRQFPDDQAPPLYRAASRWFEQNGLLEDAIHYAIHAEDFERAAALLEDHYLDILQRSEQTALFEWMAAIPPALLEKHPRLWLARGWGSAITLNSDEALRCAAQAETVMEELQLEGAAYDRLRGEARALRVLANTFAGKPAIDELSSAFVRFSEQDALLHSLLHLNLGFNYLMQGQTAQAVESFSETQRLTAAPRNPLLKIVAQTHLGETRQIRGALGMAERTFQQVIRYTKETLGERSVLLGMPYISYAELLREQNRFDEALRYAGLGIAYCQVWLPVASMEGQIALARLYASRGDWDEAFRRLEQAGQVAENSVSVLDDTFIAIHRARLALLHGDLNQAERLINAYELEKAGQDCYYYLREMIQLVLLRAAIAHLPDQPGSAPGVIERLSALIAEAERLERVSPVIEALILRAYAEHALDTGAAGDADTGMAMRRAAGQLAAQSLSKALTLGAQSGYLRIFADEGLPLLRLLDACRDHLHAPRSYVEQILITLRQEGFLSPETEEPARQPVTAQEALIPLTRRELDILERLAAGKSNQEIALECTLALTTVKKHVANILAKLEVANRTQAVAVARKNGWIG